jgi:pimeloyl-ACP methyl ester carboxylesterase
MAERAPDPGVALPPIVLVPGACLGGWCYRDVARRLRDQGHEVFCATLTGLGERVHLATPEVDLEMHIADVVNLLDYEDLSDAVLLGHSYSGAVVAGVADRRPERLRAVLYLDTGPLTDGKAIVDVQPPELRDRQAVDVRERGDGWRWPVPDRATLASGIYGGAEDLRDEHYELIERLGTPQPYRTFTSPLSLRHPEGPPGVRRVAILGSAGGMSLAAARELIAAGDPRLEVFAAPDWELCEIAAGHWSMLTAPGELAELLHALAAGPVGAGV